MVPIIGTDYWLCEKQCGWFQIFSSRIRIGFRCRLYHHNLEEKCDLENLTNHYLLFIHDRYPVDLLLEHQSSSFCSNNQQLVSKKLSQGFMCPRL